MSRFNQKSKGTKVVNLAGGEAHSQSPELELISILLTSFVKDEFYRSGNEALARLISLVIDCNKEFVAKAAIYARTKFGMRSITHVVASELAQHISGKEWAKKFYENVIYRPDDMSEILAYHTSKNGKIPNAMKKGLAKAFDKFDKYALAKYRGEGKAFKLVDVVNLVHPVPIDKNKEAIEALVKGELKSFDTWETELSKVGQVSEDEKADFKKDVWIKLIREKKLGYFALLRNLRNIMEQAKEVLPEALEQLTQEDLIKNSLVLPFRFVSALEQIENLPDSRNVVIALNQAIDISCNNVPKFDGKSLVVCDYSGSMGEGYQSHKYKGSLFGAIFAKANNADFMIFGDTAEYVPYNPMDSTLTIVQNFVRNNGQGGKIQVGHGTSFHSIFQRANSKYDRVIIFSDMQGWIGYHTPTKEFNAWKKSTDSTPFIYSFDLAGYGTMQFPEQNVFCLAGFSEKIFSIMGMLEQDKNALIKTIEMIEIK